MKTLKDIIRGVLYIIAAGMIALFFAALISGCSSVKKSYSKQIISTDSTGSSSVDSTRVIKDNTITTEFKEGEYERVTYDFPKRGADSITYLPNIDKSQNVQIYHELGHPVRITFERGKTKESKTETLDKSDSVSSKMETTAHLQKEEKTILKDKDSHRSNTIAIIFTVLIVVAAGVVFWWLKK